MSAFFRTTLSCALLLILTTTVVPAVDSSPLDAAYTTWSQGRPAEALPALRQAALENEQWHRWYDYGLCAADADEAGPAHAAWVRAAQLAPWREEPRRALASHGHELPDTWAQHAGPLATPGLGWAGPLVLLIAGIAAGLAIAGIRRPLMVTLAAIAVFIALPGLLARTDRSLADHAATMADAPLRDATGSRIASVPAGTVLTIIAREVVPGRHAVRLDDGSVGHIATDVFLPPR